MYMHQVSVAALRVLTSQPELYYRIPFTQAWRRFRMEHPSSLLLDPNLWQISNSSPANLQKGVWASVALSLSSLVLSCQMSGQVTVS